MGDENTSSTKTLIPAEIIAERARLSILDDGWLISYDGHKTRLLNHLFSTEAIADLREWLGRVVGRELTDLETWTILKRIMDSWKPSLEDLRRLFPAIVGEDANVKLAILALLTLKLTRREERIMGIIVEGKNSAGKSYFSKNMLEPLRKDKVDEFTRVTGPFIERYFRNKNVDRRILFLQEAGNIPYPLYISLSEGRLRVGLVEREGGGFKAVEVEAEGQPFLWTTSHSIILSQSIIDRSIEIFLDESEEQTKRIARFQAMLNSDYFFKNRFERFREGCSKIFRSYIWEKIPERCDVTIPFLGPIEERLEKFGMDVKFRRDFPKMIALIKGHAILKWRDRFKVDINSGRIIPRGEPRDLDEFLKNCPETTLLIIAEWEDFFEVYKLMATSFRPTLTGLSEKELRILEELKRIKNGDEMRTSSSIYAELARRTGIPSSTIRQVLIPRLEKRGFVAVARDRKPHDIDIIKDPPKDFLLDLDQLKACAEAAVEEYIMRLKSLTQVEQPPYCEPSHPPTLHCSAPENNKDLGFIARNGLESSAAYQAADFVRLSGNEELESGFSGDDEQREFIKQKAPGIVVETTVGDYAETERNDLFSKCGECTHWQAMKCEIHREWVVITPTARYAATCPSFRPKSAEWRCGE